MKFGLFHTVQWPEGSEQREMYRQAIDEIVLADALGYEGVWLTEHHFSRHGVVSDSLNVLSHLAGRTEQIRLGTAVTVLPFHNPIRAAEAAATVDVLSGGRLDLGVGRGYQWPEFNGFGVDMAERGERFDEAIDLIIRAWTSDEPFEHEGRHWRYGRVDPQPRPVQRPHPPIWVATDSEDGLRRCARMGWGVLLPQGRPLAVVEQQVERYRRVLGDEGQAYDPAKLALARAMYVHDDGEHAWATAGQQYVEFLDAAARAARGPSDEQTAANPFDTDNISDAVIFGDPARCAEQIARIQDLGVEYVLLFTRFAGLRHEAISASLELFAAEVAPTFTARV